MKQHQMFRYFVGGALLISGLLASFGAAAADGNPCSEDIAKFCKDVKPGRQALMECLEEHEAQLSNACKDYEASMERPRMESREVAGQQMRVRQACKDDVTKFCNETKGGSAGMTCLKEHASELSVQCRDAIKVASGGEEERKTK